MPDSIAVVNFLPDAGHVMPLLRVAAAFSERGYDIVCYLPQECERYLDGYTLRFVSLGSMRTAAMEETEAETLRRLSHKSIFYNAFSRYVDMSCHVWQPLKRRMITRLPFLRSHLAQQRPLFLLCDTHVFEHWYRRLGRELATPVVLHTFEGHRHWQDVYVQFYGLTTLPRWRQTLVECAGSLSNGLYGVRKRLSQLAITIEETMHRDATALRDIDDDRASFPEPVWISTGCGYLEARDLGSRLRIRHRSKVFGPLQPHRELRMSPDLRAWLHASPEPVVYVTFGSMLHVSSNLVFAILTGLMRLHVRVLWSMPRAHQGEVLRGLDLPSSIRFETFVPPLEVLAMPGVRCSINHGGAGSVQDCLVSGTPMLCIPFMWDQPFNASVVTSLGAGRRLWRSQVSPRTIEKAVQSLLLDARFSRRASRLAAELRLTGADSDVVAYILSHPSVATRRPRSGRVEDDAVAR